MKPVCVQVFSQAYAQVRPLSNDTTGPRVPTTAPLYAPPNLNASFRPAAPVTRNAQ